MLTNFLPVKLSRTILDTFRSLPCPPVVLKLIPADQTEPETLKNKPHGYLHDGELVQLKKYKLPKRRSEYLTGRICAKMAASSYLKSALHIPPAMNQIEINNIEFGNPFITFHPPASLPVPRISISHSKGYGAAIAASHPCGIDIQSQEKSLIKVQEKYCAEQEYINLLKVVPEGHELLRLSLLWSAKEAIQKRFSKNNSMPTFLDIHLQAGTRVDCDIVLFYFSLPPDTFQQYPRIITVVAGTIRNYAIAVSAPEGNG